MRVYTKRNNWFKLSFFSLLLLVGQLSFAQDQEAAKMMSSPSAWPVYFENENVIVRVSTAVEDAKREGFNHERVVFAYENKTQAPLTLTYNRIVYYGGKCFGCQGGDEYQFSLTLAPKAIEAYKGVGSANVFYIYKKDLRGTNKNVLDKFELTEFKTK